MSHFGISISRYFVVLALLTLSCSTQALFGQIKKQHPKFKIDVSSYLGDGSKQATVTGSAIQSDGTIVLSAIVGSQKIGTVRPTLLNGATETSGGVIVRISSDGKQVLSVTRVSEMVTDIDLDGTDAIYVAANTAGLLKLSPDGKKLIWQRDCGKKCDRVDAASDGEVVALSAGWPSFIISATPKGAGMMYVFNKHGKKLGEFKGHNNTADVAIDSKTQSVFSCGWKTKHARGSGKWNRSGVPVHIAHLLSQDYSGKHKWKAYDWTGKQVSYNTEGGIGNMSDTRAGRIAFAENGKLYALFMSAGGDHIFRRDSLDYSKPFKLVGGDKYHKFYNSKSEHKTVLGQYDPKTGQVLKAQEICSRYQGTKGNTMWYNNAGQIGVMKDGAVYIGVMSGKGAPLTEYDPVPKDEYSGGPLVVVLSPDLKKRLYVGRVCSSGLIYAVAMRRIRKGSEPVLVFGGRWGKNFNRVPKKKKSKPVAPKPAKALITHNPVQSDPVDAIGNGFFAIINAK